MKKLNIMLKPASSLCNLRCKYCFYADITKMREVRSYGMMSPKTVDLILEHVFADLEDGDAVTFAFQGGEPLLAGLSFFQYFVSVVKQVGKHISVDYALQTNATLINEKWCDFFKENHVLVGISLDGERENHDLCRIDRSEKGTFKEVMAALNLLNRYNVQYNVLMTLTNIMARHPQKTWRFIKEHHLQYVQFTPCLASLDAGREKDVYALTPKRFSDFYQQIFALWYDDWKHGTYTSIKLFDDLINLLAYGEVNACGMVGYCMPQLVVEADGGVYPCDFYMLDSYKIGNLCEQNVRKIYESPQMLLFQSQKRERSRCRDCAFLRICNAGCKRMQKSVCYTNGETYCGYQDFLISTIEQLHEVVLDVRQGTKA